MGSQKGNFSSTASIYKNPFEVEKEKLIRQLFEFPARIAAFVQSQKIDGNSEAVESPFSVLAAKLKARDEMEARCFVSDKCMQMRDSNETFVKQQPLRSPLIEDAECSGSTAQATVECALQTWKLATSRVITYSRRKRKLVDQSGTSREARLVAAEEVVVPSFPAPTSSLKQRDVAGFVIEVIRTLRHTRQGNTEQLFQLLSVPDFPMDKFSFLEELIRQAYCYNKDVVAKQLAQYQKELCQAHPQKSS